MSSALQISLVITDLICYASLRSHSYYAVTFFIDDNITDLLFVQDMVTGQCYTQPTINLSI